MDISKILVVAGYDPTKGSGILKDSQIIGETGYYAMGVTTAMVYENTCKVHKVVPLDVKKQFDLIKEENFHFNVVKIGLVYSSMQLYEIKEFIKELKPEWVVMDPIIKSSSKSTLTLLEKEDFLSFFKEIRPVVMPNPEEYKALFGIELPQHVSRNFHIDMVLKTFTKTDEYIMDLLSMKNGELIEIKHRRIEGISRIHGTGCIVSSLLSVMLLKEKTLKDAYIKALKVFERITLTRKIRGKCQDIII